MNSNVLTWLHQFKDEKYELRVSVVAKLLIKGWPPLSFLGIVGEWLIIYIISTSTFVFT